MERQTAAKMGSVMRSSKTTVTVRPAVEVVIDAVGGEGDGIAPGPIYAPYTLPGERVRLAPGGDRRAVEAILGGSAARVTPPCPHFGARGAVAPSWRP